MTSAPMRSASVGINVGRGKAKLSTTRREMTSAPMRRTATQASITSVGEIEVFNLSLWETWVMLTPLSRLIMRGVCVCGVWEIRSIPPMINRGHARRQSRCQRRQSFPGQEECNNLLKASFAGRVVLLDGRIMFQAGSFGGGQQIAHSSSHIRTN